MWVWLVIFAYLLNAIATLISKWLLINSIPQPLVFTFYVGLLNLVALFIIPFGGFFILPGVYLLLALCSGAAFAWAMYTMAQALHIDQASQVAPMIGGLQPLFVIIFAAWFLSEQLRPSQYIGVILLIVGSLLMALEIGHRQRHTLLPFKRRSWFTESIRYILASSLLFGLSYALLKFVYQEQNFVSGFVWSRIGTFLFVACLALLPGNWRRIKQALAHGQTKTSTLFVLGQIFGAASFLIIAYAISLGPVSVINAMQGIQYAVLFVLILFLGKRYKHLLDEPLTRPIIIQKIIGTIVIITGLAFVI